MINPVSLGYLLLAAKRLKFDGKTIETMISVMYLMMTLNSEEKAIAELSDYLSEDSDDDCSYI